MVRQEIKLQGYLIYCSLEGPAQAKASNWLTEQRVEEVGARVGLQTWRSVVDQIWVQLRGVTLERALSAKQRQRTDR